ncbi:hypothetical protein [Microbacterium sp. ZW T5_56]|uniref:hypothetical protein n=1 Tax=Microbacterium sp. ZW T5_56 TaxID=3378081 RepID=UPI0038543F4B
MKRTIILAATALVLTAFIATGCSNQPADGPTTAVGTPSSPTGNASSPTAKEDATLAPDSDLVGSESLTGSAGDALTCGHVLEISGTVWRSEFRLANGDIDEAGSAALELILRDSWATIVTGEKHGDVTAAATTVSKLAADGADLSGEEFQSATRRLDEACAAAGVPQMFRALPGQGG